MCRHIYDWNIVNCDVGQQIQLNSIPLSRHYIAEISLNVTLNHKTTTIFLQHHQFPLPVFCFTNNHYRTRPSSDNLQIATPNSNVLQKSTRSSVYQSSIMLLYVLFISFPVRHTDNFRFDGRHCIGDLMAFTMVWKFLYSKCDRLGFIHM